MACHRPGDRPHLYYQLRAHRRRQGEPKGFTWSDYRDLIIATHRNLSTPLVWCWDNLNILPLIRPCPDWRRRPKVLGCGAAGAAARGDAEPIRADR